VLVAAFPAGPWGTNCYVAATGPGEECIIVDPGVGAGDGVAEVVREHRLNPVAILVTHGHLDHMFSVTPLAGTYEATAWIHPDDRHLLANPLAGMSIDTRQMLASGMFGDRVDFAEPDDVREMVDGSTIDVAGLTIAVDHAPGHTAGSVMFRTPYSDDISEICFTGDVLFAGAIGRTDLPGGDHAAMLRSLRDKVLPLADDVVILPGHGEQSSMGRERAYNPYLQDLN
jgi:glyoxylase-like metal-dependent hydrolase (beta-lactamase superfamily II)